ncbi:MAG: hypothetical protein HUU34_00645 [Saprospiraceae bacterium]|nr:hypothetical protein [Saprospiraceae bacterium]
MRNLMLTLFLIATFATWAGAQEFEEEMDNLGGKIRAQRVAFITERLRLTPNESEKFWAIHNEYEQKQSDIRKRFKPKKTIEDMNDAEADQFINTRMDMESELLSLKRDYIRKFRDVVPARKLVAYEKADRDFKIFMLEKVRERRQQQNTRPQQRPGFRRN